MKYNQLLEEFEVSPQELASISNEVAVSVIDKMFDTYNFNRYELSVMIKAVGLFEGNNFGG